MAQHEPWEAPDHTGASPNQNQNRESRRQELQPRKSSGRNSAINWILIVALFSMGLWPVALFLLLRVLGGNPVDWTRWLGGKRNASRSAGTTFQYTPVDPIYAGPEQDASDKKRAKKNKSKRSRMPKNLVDLKKSKQFKIWGAILSVFGGFLSWEVFWDTIRYSPSWLFEDMAFPVAILAVGLALLISGIQRGRKAGRFDHYMRLIGTNRRITVRALAEAMPASQKQVCDDLQEMIARGYFEEAFLDVGHGVLVLSDEGIHEEAPPKQEPAPEPAPESPAASEETEENEFLARIRAANDAIANPTLSDQIERIEELTRKIFTLLEEHPEKEKELRSFTSYYLPQTLKILEAYGRLEAQGVEGDNITQAKQRIEAMMDKLVEGYAQQLDKLFSSDVLDITAEIAVMESMLAKDGLTKEGILYPETRD